MSDMPAKPIGRLTRSCEFCPVYARCTMRRFDKTVTRERNERRRFQFVPRCSTSWNGPGFSCTQH
jgi:hypothetical protein